MGKANEHLTALSGVPVGADSTVNFGTNTGGGDETVVVTGDLTGAATSGGTSTAGIAMITLGNVVHGQGDQIVFNNATTEVLAGSSALNVSAAHSLAAALDLTAASAATPHGGTIAGNTGVIDWLQLCGNTYLVEPINTAASAASHPALAATDDSGWRHQLDRHWRQLDGELRHQHRRRQRDRGSQWRSDRCHDLRGTSTSGIAMITLGNVHDAAGDQIVFNNTTTEVLAGTAAVNVTSAGSSLAKALDLAAADAAASQSGGKIGADTEVFDWFQLGGNTYIVRRSIAPALLWLILLSPPRTQW
jgi:hypothetical protein